MQTDDTVLCASFNQSHSHIALGTTRGWRIFSCIPFQPCQDVEVSGGISAMQMLFSSSLVALVGCGVHADDSPRRLHLWNTSTSAPVFELTLSSAVLRVLMNRARLLVVCEDAVHVFELSTMARLHTFDTAPNPRGVAALCASSASICALWPTATAPGWRGKLVLFDALHGHALCTVTAHQSTVACVALDTRGELLATASERGTLVRVYCVKTGGLLHSLRRGAMRATIHSLSFAAGEQTGAGGDEASGDGDASAAERAAGGSERRNSQADGARAASAAAAAAAATAAGAAGTGSCDAGGAGVETSGSSALLCAGSSTGTVHIWRLAPPAAWSGTASPVRSSLGSSPRGGECASPHASPHASPARVACAAADGASSGSPEPYRLGGHVASPADDASDGVAGADGRALEIATSPARLGGLRGWVNGASAERDFARVRLKLPPGSTWCSAVVQSAPSSAPEAARRMASLHVVTGRGEYYMYALNLGSGACLLQDERRLLT